MAYIQDEDLEFIGCLSNDRIEKLYNILVFNEKGEYRTNEDLSSCYNRRQYGDNFRMYWADICEELQKNGGNSIANFFRKEGVRYIEILTDVCKKLQINTGEHSTRENLENKLLEFYISKSLTSMSDAEKNELIKEVYAQGMDECGRINLQKALAGGGIGGVFALGAKGSQIILIIASKIAAKKSGVAIAAKVGAKLAGNGILGETAGVLGAPVVWGIIGVWAAIEIAGSAYRVTIPAVFQISLLRREYELGISQYDLGYNYQFGINGVEQNIYKAIECYRASAECGNSDAQYNLGVCYYNGDGVDQNYTEAVAWYTISANQGNSDAQYNLGMCYYNGDGVCQNYIEATNWFVLSANQGNSDAQNILGFCYYNGYGVDQNYTEAAEWYTLSANQGNIYGISHLGDCYYNGYGVEKDYTEAIKLYTIAANKGDIHAQEKLKYINKYINKEGSLGYGCVFFIVVTVISIICFIILK